MFGPRRPLRGAALAGAWLLASGAGAFDLTLTPFASGLTQPVGLANAGDSRLFVLERQGIIKIILDDGTVLTTPFLNITGRVDDSANEEGLLGIAFHPDYATNGYFYLNFTTAAGRTRIARYSVTADPNVAEFTSQDVLLTVNQPFGNHNAGAINFGPDGYLYVPLGDGGSGGDPGNRAQNPATLLGKIVRIDVDSGPGSPADCKGAVGSGHYTIPASNPLIDGPGGACDEIWALGLRNPWRSSFDRLTGDLWVGDVGQFDWEEVDFQPAGSASGQNYGWRCYEGNHPFNLAGCGAMANYTFPVFEYFQSGGACAVIGGYVYRGSLFPALEGRYLLSDACTGNFWDLEPSGLGGFVATLHTELAASGMASFGEGADGELYTVNRLTGAIHRLGSDPVPVTLMRFTID